MKIFEPEHTNSFEYQQRGQGFYSPAPSFSLRQQERSS